MDEINKFNPYHDQKGRFTTSGGAASFTIRTRDQSKQKLADKAKERETARTASMEPKKETPKSQWAGFDRGEPMTHEQADSGNVNPNLWKDDAYRVNCQTCVVTYEARRRGYEVEARPNKKGYDETSRIQRRIGIQNMTAYVNAEQKSVATRTYRQMHDALDKEIVDGGRYHISLQWKNGNCHVITIERVNGRLRLYDPQVNETRTGKDEITSYFRDVRCTVNSARNGVRLTRVDNAEFVDDIEKILTKPTGK